jgi:hypothetical protein
MTARGEILDWISARFGDIVTDSDDLDDAADRVAEAEALDAAAFAAEIVDLTRILGESVRTAAHYQALTLTPDFTEDTAEQAVSVLACIAMALGVGRVDWPSRPQARAARARLVTKAQAAYAVSGALGADLHSWLMDLVGLAVRLVSDIAANAAPVVRIEAGFSLPSTVAAYQLYGDANRASGLVDVAGAGTPLVMPTKFDALAS